MNDQEKDFLEDTEIEEDVQPTKSRDPPPPARRGRRCGVGWGGCGVGWARLPAGRVGGGGPGPSPRGLPRGGSVRRAWGSHPSRQVTLTPPPGSTAAGGRHTGGRSLSHRPCQCEGLAGGASGGCGGRRALAMRGLSLAHRRRRERTRSNPHFISL